MKYHYARPMIRSSVVIIFMAVVVTLCLETVFAADKIPELVLTNPDNTSSEFFKREYKLDGQWNIAKTNKGYTYLVTKPFIDTTFNGKKIEVQRLQVHSMIEGKGKGQPTDQDKTHFDWEVGINAVTNPKPYTNRDPGYFREITTIERIEDLNHAPIVGNILKVVSGIKFSPQDKTTVETGWTYDYTKQQSPLVNEHPYKQKAAPPIQPILVKDKGVAIQLVLWTGCKYHCQLAFKDTTITITGRQKAIGFQLPAQLPWIFVGIGLLMCVLLVYAFFGQYRLRKTREKARIHEEKMSHINNITNLQLVDNISVDDNLLVNVKGGNYYGSINTSSKNHIQGNYIYMSQNLTQSAAQIQEVIEQLQKGGVSFQIAKEQVANDIANQVHDNPSDRDKLVKWGQSLGDSVISDVVKGVVKLAIRFAGIPLP
jgi:hypothetical protein